MSKEFSFHVGPTLDVQPFTTEKLGFAPGSVFLTIENANIRYFFSGQHPNNTSGHRMTPSFPLTFTNRVDIENLMMCSESGTATVNATVKGL